MSRYFPLFIDLEGKKIAVVGAGKIASRRIRTLLEFGAELTVLAPEASEEVRCLAGAGRLTWRREAYRAGLPGFLEGALLALAATDSRAVNLAVREECKSLGIPVNLADDKEKCDFYFPGIGGQFAQEPANGDGAGAQFGNGGTITGGFIGQEERFTRTGPAERSAVKR